MPLKAGLKKKTEQEKEKAYTKQTNNVSLPKKSSTSSETKAAAQSIKNNVSGKKTTTRVQSNRDVRPQTSKQKQVYNRNEYRWTGSEKKSYRVGDESVARTQNNRTNLKSDAKTMVDTLTIDKVDTTPRVKKEDPTPTRNNDRDNSTRKYNKSNSYNKHKLDEGAKDIQNRALSGALKIDEPTKYYTDIHGRKAVDDRISDLDDLFNAGGKFLSNFYDSTVDNSPVGAAYTMATGERISDNVYDNNPYEAYRHQGVSAGAGRMAGMAVDYGLMRSMLNPQLTKATEAVMNGTKVGKMIQGSSVLGKIGQTVGTATANDIATGLVKETISDATLGFGQNALINYGEGLRGKDFWEQQAKDTALDFLVGGAMEGVGIGRQIRKTNNLAKSIANESPTSMLNESVSRKEYLDDLWARIKDRFKTGNDADAARSLREASGSKVDDLIAEHNKVIDMTEEQFNRYRQGLPIEEPVEEVAEATVKEAETPKTNTLNAKNRKVGADSRYNAYGERIGKEQSYSVDTAENGGVATKNTNVENNPKEQYNVTEGELKNGQEIRQEPIYGEGTADTNGVDGIRQGGRADDGVREPRIESGSEASGDSGHPQSVLVNEQSKKTLSKDKAFKNKEVSDYSKDVKGFNEHLGRNRKDAKYGYCVDLIDEQNIPEGSKLITTDGGGVTCALKPKGKGNDIAGFSKSPSAPRGAAEEAMLNAIAMGGDRCDAYGRVLADMYHNQYGLVPVARVKYDEGVIRAYSEASEIEPKLKMFEEMRAAGNEPDVFVFAKFDSLDDTISKRMQGGYGHLTSEQLEKLPVMEYDDALQYRDDLLDIPEKRAKYLEDGAKSDTQADMNLEAETKAQPEAETKEKAPAKEEVKETPKTEEKPKATLKVREKNKDAIIQKMQEAGVELPDNVKSLTEKELRALNDGTLSLEDAKKIDHTKTSKKNQLKLSEYDDIENQLGKDDAQLKDELISKYVDDKNKLGEPLSEAEIDNLRKMDEEGVRNVIDKDAVERSGYKSLDEYYDNTLFKSENEKPELVRKNVAEEGSLKSEQLRKGSNDAYTTPEAPEKKMPLTKAEKEVVDTAERHLKMDVHVTAKRISSMTDVDESTVREILEKQGYELRGDNGNVWRKEATATVDPYTTTTTGGGTATFTSTTGQPKKELPKKISKEHTGKVLERKADYKKEYARMNQLNDESLTKSNRGKTQKTKLDASKLDGTNFSSTSARTSLETGVPKEKTVKEKIASAKKKFRRDIIDSSDELRRIDRATGNTKLENKYKMSQGSRSQAAHQLVTEITDRSGNKIHDSFRSVFAPYKKNMDDINLYMFNKHEMTRAIESNKNALSLSIYGYTKEEAENVADSVVKALPELSKKKNALAKWLENGMQNDDVYKQFTKEFDGFNDVIRKLNQDKAATAKATVEALESKYGKETLEKLSENWTKAYNTWFDEWAVKSGLVDKSTVKEWRSKYKNYIPTFRVKDLGEGAMTILDSPEVFHSVRGKSEAKLLGVEDQIGIMVNRVTSAARRNELNASIYEAIKRNPNAGYGKIISSGDAVKDIDEALGIVGKSSGDIINGSKTITFLKDGKKINMEVSDDIAATLRAMQDGADTGTLTRIGKWITNPIKLGITGANPTFVVSNAVRDMATALIQSEHGMHKTVAGWGKAIAGMTGINKEYAELLKRYKFAGGEMAGYYVQGKGFDTTAILSQKGIKGVMNRVGQVMTFLGEQGETIPRFGEFINTMEKTGNFEKAVRDAAEVTVDFSKHGASDGVKLLDAWTLYLNAGLQGIDKFARTLAEHPIRTSVRTATVVGAPAMLLLAINNDNPWYHELSDRTRQNYFCIPKLDGDKDEDGNCKEFIRLPMNREYGAVLGAGIDSIWRAIKGDENPTSGFATTLSENFLPNDPIRDNVLAPLLINIPTNKDYKGSKILTSSEFNDFKAGKNADLQYDATTSGAAMGISKLANKIMGDNNIPILKYLKSPKLVDYVIDSYGGYYGQVAQSATQQEVDNAGDVAKNVILKPYADKFTTDARYSNSTINQSWDDIAGYKADKNRAESEGKDWSEAHAKYQAANNVMKSIYDSMDAEKEIKNDSTLSDKEKKEMIDELREARVELAKTMDAEVEKAAKEYREAPTYSSLSDKAKEKYEEAEATLPNVSRENWAKLYKHVNDTSNERYDETGSYATAEEKRLLLLEDGVTSYKVAQSILGTSLSEKTWNNSKDSYKNGQTYDDLVKYNLEKEERQKNMTETEKKFDNNFRTRSDTKYDGKTVSKSVYDKFLYEVQYVDKHTDNNGSIKQSEAKNAIENLDKMYGLTEAQKSYLWYLAENDGGWKNQPYGKWNG